MVNGTCCAGAVERNGAFDEPALRRRSQLLRAHLRLLLAISAGLAARYSPSILSYAELKQRYCRLKEEAGSDSTVSRHGPCRLHLYAYILGMIGLGLPARMYCGRH